MLNFEITKTESGKVLETDLSGKLLLTTPQLNKGTAFTEEERREFGLLGKLPESIETLDEQVVRCYKQFSSYHTLLQKNIYLRSLHETNEILFYKLVSEKLQEMLPVIYTPIVGTAVRQFSLEYRRPRGLYIAYPHRKQIADMLKNRSHPDIKLIVVTDGEGVLGIGDQGIGAIDIPIAKLMVYSIAAGINPLNTLPIMLDAGTNNETLRDDPMYLGWRHARVEGKAYDEFVHQFIEAVQHAFPDAYLHWEDFGRRNARYNLDRYRNQICSFNDDIQGTGVVTLAALLAAVKASGTDIKEQRIVVFGAGSAGVGISEQIVDAMVHAGLPREQALKQFWLIASKGLLTDHATNITEERKPFVRSHDEVRNWMTENQNVIGLMEVVKHVKPTILIGTSTQTNAFNEAIVKEMAQHVERPIIFPLSNPTEKSEAEPKDLLHWTDGKALIATGSPFDPVPFREHIIHIAQCNNALVFPGIGLGVMAVKAKTLTDEMLWAATQATTDTAPIRTDPKGALLPAIENTRHLSHKIAIAVAKQAIAEGVAQCDPNADIEQLIEDISWQPEYLPYRKTNNEI